MILVTSNTCHASTIEKRVKFSLPSKIILISKSKRDECRGDNKRRFTDIPHPVIGRFQKDIMCNAGKRRNAGMGEEWGSAKNA